MLIAANNGKVVYRTKLDGSNNQREPLATIDTGVENVTSVAVDWVTSNIYMVDSAAGTIVVCSWKGDNCAVLVSDLNCPYSVLVNVKSRKLLWSEWGSEGQAGSIHSTDLDGSQPTLFVDNLNRPQNLVLDETVGALFWVARSESTYIIQSLKLNSGHKKVYQQFCKT
ncbi:low-density lipoprotein receptor-like [Mercenaria mercenaria]|uniref:low-density lipoprotein receptor-like n=1 Tax=Mercenaria mercenaria TaxID=6596 RepID=UPI00234ED72C|nr:low-density lipoprotein receptor-like [Mercenaria mercenaria]